MAYPKYRHDPDSTIDYQVDWTDWLAAEGNDTITGSTWIVPTGLTKNSDTYTTTSATVWISGGTVGTLYTVTNRITTAGGRVEDQSIVLNCVEL